MMKIKMNFPLIIFLALFIIHSNEAFKSDGQTSTFWNANSDGAVLIMDEHQREICIKKSCNYGQYFEIENVNKTFISTNKTKVHLAVLAPAEMSDTTNERPIQILATTLPAIELAIETVKEQQLLNGVDLVIHYRDTKSSSTLGPLAAFDLFSHNEADVFMGPIHDYVLAPVITMIAKDYYLRKSNFSI